MNILLEDRLNERMKLCKKNVRLKKMPKAHKFFLNNNSILVYILNIYIF